jgi:O-antigen ligase
MTQSTRRNLIAKYLYIGAPIVTVTVVAGPVLDPVNVSKLLILGMTSMAIIFLMASNNILKIFGTFKSFTFFLIAFAVFGFVSMISSSSPLSQNFYGEYGRNTGFLTYFFFVALTLASLTLISIEHFQKLIYGLLAAGIINVIYGIWVKVIGDPIPWNNNYGALLGTFGNPNFAGAFFGMITTAALAMGLAPHFNWKFKLGCLAFAAISFYENLQTHAVQGIVVTFAGIALIGFFFLKSKFESSKILFGYTISILTAGAFAIAGALQVGPLQNLIYKRSVSLRGVYWEAGLNMGLNHPLTGVGMDGYGDWYTRSRSLKAVNDLPGAGVVSNAAHNVFIDIFAYGGFPLFFAYFFIILATLLSILRFSVSMRSYDWTFVTLVVSWSCYQLQSLISINQIGIAIWGWILSGAIMAYTRHFGENSGTREANPVNLGRKNTKTVNLQSQNLPLGLIAFVGAIAGALISIPPYIADSKWVTAQKTMNLEMLKKALSPDYFNPSNSIKYQSAVRLLENSNLPEEAILFARRGVVFNPNELDAWKMLYYATNSSLMERSRAKAELIRLDPLNSAWKELP